VIKTKNWHGCQSLIVSLRKKRREADIARDISVDSQGQCLASGTCSFFPYRLVYSGSLKQSTYFTKIVPIWRVIENLSFDKQQLVVSFWVLINLCQLRITLFLNFLPIRWHNDKIVNEPHNVSFAYLHVFSSFPWGCLFHKARLLLLL
jgi:hypothetical protein